VAASDKIGQELGWRPRYGDLETIIETAWKWHQRGSELFRQDGSTPD